MERRAEGTVCSVIDGQKSISYIMVIVASDPLEASVEEWDSYVSKHVLISPVWSWMQSNNGILVRIKWSMSRYISNLRLQEDYSGLLHINPGICGM
jgi:hypothetical protein